MEVLEAETLTSGSDVTTSPHLDSVRSGLTTATLAATAISPTVLPCFGVATDASAVRAGRRGGVELRGGCMQIIG